MRDSGSFRPLAAEVNASAAVYGPFVHAMSPFFGNHDVARLSTELAGCSDWSAPWGVCRDVLAEGPIDRVTDDESWLVDRLSLAWALVATRPGVPLLYYGDELGLAGSNDPDNRRDRPWSELSAAQRALKDRVAELAQVRADSVALRRGEQVEVWVDDDVYIIARIHDDQTVLAWFSRYAEGPRALPVRSDVVPADATLVDLLGDDDVDVVDGRVTLQLRRFGYGVLEVR